MKKARLEELRKLYGLTPKNPTNELFPLIDALLEIAWKHAILEDLPEHHIKLLEDLCP